MHRLVHKLIQNDPARFSLFFAKLNTHAVCAVKCHFDAGKKSHQQQRKDKPNDNAQIHISLVKIKKLAETVF